MPAITTRKLKDITIMEVTGKFTVADIYKIEEDFYEGSPTRFMVWDFSRAPDIVINAQSAQLIATLISHYPEKRQDAKTAIIAKRGQYYDMAEQFCELVSQRKLALEVDVFDNADQAALWLGRPIPPARPSSKPK